MMELVRSWLLVFGALLLMMLMLAFWWASRALFEPLPERHEASLHEPESGFAGVGHNDSPVVDVGKDVAAIDAGAIENERVLVFRDREAMERFLRDHGDGIKVLGMIGRLNALRIGFTDMASLLADLGDDHEELHLFPVVIPPMPDGSIQAGAVPLGDGVLAWLGVDAANANWGKGVKIAVLDTGVIPDPSLGRVLQLIELVSSGTDLSMHNGHGTAVASVIVGLTADVPGVAPGAEIISIRVADDYGISNSFLLAQGIIEAVDAGAQLINISMSGFGHGGLLQQAVDYALASGVLVIAAAGNNGIDQVAYPAANVGVIGVGAVDAIGSHLGFSNSGPEVDVAAPGFGVNANWMADYTVSASGTSFSTPIVTGALAVIMSSASSEMLTPQQAWDLMVEYLNDGGQAGPDYQLGGGMPDLGRVFNRDVPGIHDAALASMALIPADAGHPFGQIELVIQNRGTERLLNTGVAVESGGVLRRINLTTLEPGEVQAVRVPVSQSLEGRVESEFLVRSGVWLGDGQIDVRPENDTRQMVFGTGE